MKKIFTLLVVMMMGICSWAEEVTINFDNDYQTLFPTLTGVSSGSGENYVSDGDFTDVTVSTPVNGVMVIVAPDEDAKTPSRIWSGSPRLRMYSGSFSVVSTSGPITKIEFTGHNTNFNLTPVTGSLEGKTWTSTNQTDQTVVFMVAKNTQINSIVVTIGDGGEVNPGDDDDDDDDAAGFLDDFKFTSGSITDNGNQVLFDFSGYVKDKDYEVTAQIDLGFENDICNSCVLKVTYPSEELAQAKYQDYVANAEKDGIIDVKIEGKTVTIVCEDYIGLSKIVVKSMFKVLLELDQETGNGTLEKPISPVMANVVAGALESGEITDFDIYVKGIIADIKYTFNEQYGTATFFISKDGKNDYTFQAYSVYYLENKPWVEGNTQIKVGDEVIICGKLTNYKGTPETASKQAYIYSLNGVTKNENGDDPTPEVKEIGIAEALNIIAALEDGKTTSEEYLVKGVVTSIKEVSTNYGNATFNIADNATDDADKQVTVFRAKGFDNEKIEDENIIKVGDEVVVKGKLQKFVKNGEMTPEVSSCYIYSVNGNTAIANVIATRKQSVIYNLAGQRVNTMGRGLYIVNGKKVIVR